MIGWLLATTGTALLGSVLPVVNIELYLIGVLSLVDGLPWWALALAATVGQLAGKTLFFMAGKGSVRLGERLGRMTQVPSNNRTARWLEQFRRKAEQRPVWGLAVLFVGAVTGIPPFTVMSFVSGAAGARLPSFLVVSFVGRTAHFLAVAGAPELVRQLPLISA
jgi:membrane protein YqaA with SNARE-associated domain